MKRKRAQLKWTNKINYKLQLGHDGSIKMSNFKMAHAKMLLCDRAKRSIHINFTLIDASTHNQA